MERAEKRSVGGSLGCDGSKSGSISCVVLIAC